MAMYPTKKVKKVSIPRLSYPLVAGFTVSADTDCVTINARQVMAIAMAVVLGLILGLGKSMCVVSNICI